MRKLRMLWRVAFHFNLSQLAIPSALRAPFGLLLPPGIGGGAGQLLEGAAVAGGALSLSMGSRTETGRAADCR